MISVEDLGGCENRGEIGGIQKEGNGKSTRFLSRSHPSLFSSGKVDLRQSREEIWLGVKLTAKIAGSSWALRGGA